MLIRRCAFGLAVMVAVAPSLAQTSTSDIPAAWGRRGTPRPSPAPMPRMPAWQPGPSPGAGFSGIGGIKANIDLISSPIRNRLPAAPQPTVTYFPARADLPAGSWGRGCAPPPRAFEPDGWPAPGYAVATDGLAVDGTYSGEKWKIGFHLGGGGITDCLPARRCGTVCTPTSVWWGWGSPYWYSRSLPAIGYTDVYVDPRLTAPPMVQAPAPAPASGPEPEPTAFQRGAMALYLGDEPRAVSEFRSHVKENPSDTQALRALALALIADNQLEDGAAVMRSAYRIDPALATQPIRFGEMGLGETRLRGLLVKSVGFAHRVNSASAWLTVAAIMQAENREALALDMLARADKAGLDRDISDRLRAELK